MSLWTRKPIEPPGEAHGGPTLRRELTALHLMLLGVGSTIGAGIFVITGTAAAQYAGPAIALSFVIAAFACLCTALCYGELASLIPSSGGAYSYAYVTMGELSAWIIGWCLVLEYLMCSATIAVGWSGYFTATIEQTGIAIPSVWRSAPLTFSPEHDMVLTGAVFNVPAAAIVLLMTVLLLFGIRQSAYANNIMVAIKVGIILVVIACGAWLVDTANWDPFIPENTGESGRYGWSGVLRGAGVIFFAFIGFDGISTSAQEARNPRRDLGIGIVGGLLICTALYVGMSLVMTGLIDFRQLDVPNPVSVALSGAGGRLEWLGPFVNVSALVGLASAVFTGIYGQSRVFYAMAVDGLIPRKFAEVDERTRVPRWGTIAIGLVCALLAGLFPLDVLGELVSIGTLLAFAIVCASVLVLRRRVPREPRAFRVPFAPLTPIVGMSSCLYLMYTLPTGTWIRLAYWLALGLAIYFFYGMRHSRASRLEAEPPAQASRSGPL